MRITPPVAALLAVLLPLPALAQSDTETPASENAPAASAPAEATPQAPEAAPNGTDEASSATSSGASEDGTAAATGADDGDASAVAGAEEPVNALDPLAPSEYVTEQPDGFLFSSDFVGYAVYGNTEEKIGDINDLLLSPEGQLSAVVIGVGGFLGVGEKDVAVPLGRLDVSRVDGSYQISIDATEDELRAAPDFTRADGTTSDRLGAFERAYTRARARAEEAYASASARAGELYDEAAREAERLSQQASDEARELIEQGRQAVRDLRGESDGDAAEGAEDATQD